MKRKAYLSAGIALLATFSIVGGTIGIVETAEASSSRSHSQSLAGRFFAVTVKELNDFVPTSENCYSFEEDGTWIDPLFLDGFVIPGTWIQHTGGFVKSYTAFARTPFPIDVFEDGTFVGSFRLIQNGKVFPTWRRGELWLKAYSTLIVETADGDVVFLNFLSTGKSVDSCD